MSESVNCLDVVELFFLENNFIDSETKTSIVEKCILMTTQLMKC